MSHQSLNCVVIMWSQEMTTSTPFDNSSTSGIAWALEALLHKQPAIVERLYDELEQTQDD